MNFKSHSNSKLLSLLSQQKVMICKVRSIISTSNFCLIARERERDPSHPPPPPFLLLACPFISHADFPFKLLLSERHKALCYDYNTGWSFPNPQERHRQTKVLKHEPQWQCLTTSAPAQWEKHFLNTWYRFFFFPTFSLYHKSLN